MKIWLVFILFLVSFSASAQTTVNTSSPRVVDEKYNGSFLLGLKIPAFADTTTATSKTLIDSIGLIIYTRDTKTVFIRDTSTGRHKWSSLSGAGGGVTTVFGRSGTVVANTADYASFYPVLSGAYNDPSWINTLSAAKISAAGNVTAASSKISLGGTPSGAGLQNFSIDVNQGALSLQSLGGLLNVNQINATGSYNDSNVLYENGTWGRVGTPGGGATNANVGTGYRLAIPGTNNIKTFFLRGYIVLDSTSNTNGITIYADTSTGKLATQTMVDLKLSISDTSVMLSKYFRKSDTTSLSNRINTKLNISDTAAMVLPYLKKVDTTTLSVRINSKLNISDSASMLVPYLKKADTAAMLSPYAKSGGVVKYSDTAAMLAPSLRKVDTTAMLVPYLRKFDTLAMLSKYLRKIDTASLSTRINLKLDSIRRKVGSDSVFWYNNGSKIFAFRDSVGSGSGGTTRTDSALYDNAWFRGNVKIGDTTYTAPLKLYVDGSSISAGTGPTIPARTYYNRIATYHSYVVTNLAVSGSSIAIGTLSPTPLSTRAHTSFPIWDSTWAYMMFDAGVNDVTSAYSDTSLYKPYLIAVVDTAIAHGWPLNRIVIVSPPYSPSRALDSIYAYANATVARSLGVRSVDVWHKTFAYGSAASADGLHPSDVGSFIMAQLIDDSLISANTHYGGNLLIHGSDTVRKNHTVLGTSYLGDTIVAPVGFQVQNVHGAVRFAAPPLTGMLDSFFAIRFVPNSAQPLFDSLEIRYVAQGNGHEELQIGRATGFSAFYLASDNSVVIGGNRSNRVAGYLNSATSAFWAPSVAANAPAGSAPQPGQLAAWVSGTPGTGFNNLNSGIWNMNYSDNTYGSRMDFKRGRGTSAAPTALGNGDYIGYINFWANTTTGLGGNKQVAGLGARVMGTVSTSTAPTNVYIYNATGGESINDVYADAFVTATFLPSHNTILGSSQTGDSLAVLQLAAASATNAQIWFKSSHVDPTSPLKGSLWFNDSTDAFNFRHNSITTNLLRRVDSVRRKVASDSVFEYVNGTKLFAFKDSTGGGGSFYDSTLMSSTKRLKDTAAALRTYIDAGDSVGLRVPGTGIQTAFSTTPALVIPKWVQGFGTKLTQSATDSSITNSYGQKAIYVTTTTYTVPDTVDVVILETTGNVTVTLPALATVYDHRHIRYVNKGTFSASFSQTINLTTGVSLGVLQAGFVLDVSYDMATSKIWGYLSLTPSALGKYQQIISVGKFYAPTGGGTPPYFSTNIDAPSTANKVEVVRFYLPSSISVGNLAALVTTAQSGQTMCLGIYDTTGFLLVRSGTISVATTGKKTGAASTVTILQAGYYYAAYTCTSTTPLISGVFNTAQDGWEDSYYAGEAANSASAGLLPTTLGTITANSQNSPLIQLTN